MQLTLLSAAPETPVMLEDVVVLVDDDAVGIGVDLDRTPRNAALTECLLLSNRKSGVFETIAATAWRVGAF